LLIKDESLDESFSKQSSTKPQTEFEPLKFTFRRNSNKEEMAQTSTPSTSNEPIQVDKERDETPKTSIEPIVISKIKSSAELKTPNSASKNFDKVYEEAFNKYSQGASAEKKLQTKIKSKPLITDSTSQSTVVSSSTSTASSNKPLNLIIKKNKTDAVFQVNKVPKLIINTSQLKDSSSKPLEFSEEQFELKKPDLNLLNSFDENANDAIEFDGKDEDKNSEPIIWKPVFNTNTTNSPVSSPLVQPATNITEMSDSFLRESSSAVPISGPLLQPFTIKKTSVDTSDTHNESTPQSDSIAHKSKKKKKLKDKHKESPEKDKDKSKKKKKKKDKEKDKEKSQSNLESSHNTSLSSSEQKKKDKKLKKLMKKEQKKAESSNKEQQQERDESHSATSTPEIKETTQKKLPNLIEAVR